MLYRRRGKVAWRRHPLFVYADFEAMQNAKGIFVANLLSFVRQRRANTCVGR